MLLRKRIMVRFDGCIGSDIDGCIWLALSGNMMKISGDHHGLCNGAASMSDLSWPR